MARGATSETVQTYLVEHYRPGLHAPELGRLAARIREAVEELAREGASIRFVRSVIVPEDESLLCLLDAASEQLVRDAYARAGIPFERISATVAEEA
jgi:20S proteasome alpha/beta subunit